MSRISISAVTLCVAAAMFAGCGRSGETTLSATTGSSTTSAVQSTDANSAATKVTAGQPLTRAELTTKAEALCKRAIDDRESVSTVTGPQYGYALLQLGINERVIVAEMGKLIPPVGLVGDWQRIVADDEALAGATVHLGELVGSYNRKAFRALISASEKVHKSMEALASRDGLSECAQFA